MVLQSLEFSCSVGAHLLLRRPLCCFISYSVDSDQCFGDTSLRFPGYLHVGRVLHEPDDSSYFPCTTPARIPCKALKYGFVLYHKALWTFCRGSLRGSPTKTESPSCRDSRSLAVGKRLLRSQSSNLVTVMVSTPG